MGPLELLLKDEIVVVVVDFLDEEDEVDGSRGWPAIWASEAEGERVAGEMDEGDDGEEGDDGRVWGEKVTDGVGGRSSEVDEMIWI